MRRIPVAVGVVAALILMVTGCGDTSDSGGPPAVVQTPGAAPQAASTSTAPPAELVCEIGELPPPAEPAGPAEPELRQELLELQTADQAERTGEAAGNNDAERTDRLRDIISRYGWPTAELVGADGASAAWVIAQHADLDVEFQREALELMCAAVAEGGADPTELAYLEDRVAVNSGGLQFYGTQFGGCEDGEPIPRPLQDEDRVHERRAQVGLQPLDEYLAYFAAECTG